MDGARGINVYGMVHALSCREIGQRNAATPFPQKLMGLVQFLLEALCRLHQLVPGHVVEHHHIRTCTNRLSGFSVRLHFIICTDRKARSLVRRGHSRRDRSRAAYVMIFEHEHTTQIVAMRIHAAKQHTILFHQANTWRCLAGTSLDALEATRVRGI